MVNKTVVVREVRGTVKIRVRGSNRFVDLDAAQGIPVGSTVDTKRGTVELTSIPRAGAAPEKAQFLDGIFRVTQSRGITDLKLTEALALLAGAPAQPRASRRSASCGATGTGKFRTTGSYSAATIRGTEWLVQDTCTTTLTRVKTGRGLRARQGQGAHDHPARGQAVHGAEPSGGSGHTFVCPRRAGRLVSGRVRKRDGQGR